MSEATPCDRCELADVCAIGLACEAFARFVARGTLAAWKHTPRLPSRRLYGALFAAPAPNARAINADERRRLVRARARERRRRDPAAVNAALRAWRHANPEHVKAYGRRRAPSVAAYYAEHRERILPKHRAYYAAHRDELNAKARAKYARERESIRARQNERRRRARQIRIQTTTSEKSLALARDRGSNNPRAPVPPSGVPTVCVLELTTLLADAPEGNVSGCGKVAPTVATR